MMNAENFSKNLKKYRQMRGISQNNLAKVLYVSAQSVSKWEKGTSFPDISNLCAIANALEITCDKLFENESPDDNNKYFIGIDGGGTKTEMVLFRHDGEILHRLVTSGSNPNVIGMDECCKVICDGIGELLSHGVSVCGVFAGIAGSGVGDNARLIEVFIKAKFPAMTVKVCSDSANVISSVRGCTDGVGVIWGTGFTVCVYKGETSRRFAGWGYLFEELGSGFAIGKAVLKHCLECNDSMKERTLLCDMAEKALGGKIGDRLGHIYTKDKDYVASFARTAFEAYRKGDETAKKIVSESIEWMANIIVHAIEVTNCPKTVVISGGLTANADILHDVIGKCIPGDVKIIIPDMPQIYGACLMCLKECKMSSCATEEFEEKFKADYLRRI
ncbi:MAG: XRE family transcriptional regulator [Clostridia bacterium]|nr:XRE family transcriptional regulator [Clostridia bacterium]